MAPDSRNLLIAWAALAFLDGAASAWWFPGQAFPPTSLISTVIYGFIVYMWYRLDSDTRSYRRTRLLSVAVVGATVLGLPYYLFRTRGFRRGARAVLAFVLLVLGSGVLNYLGYLAAAQLRT